MLLCNGDASSSQLIRDVARAVLVARLLGTMLGLVMATLGLLREFFESFEMTSLLLLSKNGLVMALNGLVMAQKVSLRPTDKPRYGPKRSR